MDPIQGLENLYKRIETYDRADYNDTLIGFLNVRDKKERDKILDEFEKKVKALSATQRVKAILDKIKPLAAHEKALAIYTNTRAEAMIYYAQLVAASYTSYPRLFQPEPGEKPHTDGLYYRHINGHDIGFEAGGSFSTRVQQRFAFLEKEARKNKTTESKTAPKKSEPKETPRKFNKEGFDNTDTKISRFTDKAIANKLAIIQKKYENGDSWYRRVNKGWYEQSLDTHTPDIDGIKKMWNEMPPEKRKNIKEFKMVHNQDDLAGSYNVPDHILRLNMQKRKADVPGTLEHEVAHSNFEVHSPEKQGDFAVKGEGLYLSPYNKTYLPGNENDPMPKLNRLTRMVEKIEKGIEIGDMSGDPMRALAWMSDTNEKYGFNLESYKDGSFRKWFNDYSRRRKIIAANELHSEYLRIRNVDKSEQNHRHYKQVDKIYKEVFGDV